MKPIAFVVIFANVFFYTNSSSADDIDELSLNQNELNSSFLNQSAISDSELDGNRAQGTSYTIDDININNMDLDADFKNNINFSLNSQTGANIVDNGAFSNTSGMATAILNSGNNVLIQNATLVNISIE